METTINSNIINPRYYQIPGDRLEAKQSMEPIAIGSGIGPITGFDIVDTTQTNIRITGSANPNITQAQRLAAWPIEQKTIKLSKDGQPGIVVNSHITPSGLLSIDPMWLDTGLPVSQFNVHSFLVVRATLDYTTEIVNNLETIIPPSISNFIFTRVTAWVHSGVPVTTLNLLNTNYNGVLGMLSSAGITLNESKEVIIGIYEFNPPETIREQNPWFYNYVGNIVPNIPYYNIWPPRSNFNRKVDSLVQFHSEQIEWLMNNRIIEVDTPNIKDNAVTGPKVANSAITANKIADGAISTSKVSDGAITTVKIANNAINTEKLADDTISTIKVKDNAITGSKIANGSILTDHLDGGVVNADKIKNLTITSGKIANGAITPEKIVSTGLRGDNISVAAQLRIGGGLTGEPRSLIIENKMTNVYWTEIVIQGDEVITLPVPAYMATPVNNVTNIRFTRPATDIGGVNPVVKLYKYVDPSGWVLEGTYQFTSFVTYKETALIPLSGASQFKVIIE